MEPNRLAMRMLLLMFFAVATLGCSRLTTGSGATPPFRENAPPLPTELPAISADDPEVKAVLEACGTFRADVGIDKVEGIAHIEHAYDVPHYVPLHPSNVEIQTDEPAWVVAFDAEILQLKYGGEVWIDPVCVHIAGEPGMFATGARRLADGTMITPPPVPYPPDRPLLPLANPRGPP